MASVDELSCPACKESFTMPASQPVALLSCGHSVCSPCGDALNLSDCGTCPMCGVSVEGIAENTAMQDLLAAVSDDGGGRLELEPGRRASPASFASDSTDLMIEVRGSPSASPVDADGVAHAGQGGEATLVDLVAECSRLAAELTRAAATVASARTHMLEHTAASCDAFTSSVKMLTAALEAHAEEVVRDAHAALTARNKALETQEAQISVSISQLNALARLGESVRGWPDGSAKAVSARAVLSAALPAHRHSLSGPCVAPLVCIDSKVKDVLAVGVGSLTKLVLEGPSAGACVVTGSGLWRFRPNTDPDHRTVNVVTVVCNDEHGEVCPWLSPDDVSLGVTVVEGGEDGAEGAEPPAPPTQTSPGTFTFVYSVREGVRAVELALGVCGQVARVVRVHGGCGAEGVRVATLSTAPHAARHVTGIAASPDGRVLYLCHQAGHCVHVMDVASGAVTHTWGGRGHQPGQLRFPERVCVAPCGNLVVADSGNQRVQELRGTDGAAVRVFPTRLFDGKPHAVAASADVIAVGLSGLYGTHGVVLLSYATGEVVCRLGPRGHASHGLGSVAGVTLTPDGARVLVAEAERNRVSIFAAADGTFLKSLAVRAPTDIALTGGGDIVVSCDDGGQTVRVLGSGAGQELRAWPVVPHPGDRRPVALTVGGTRLFAVDALSPDVHVFE